MTPLLPFDRYTECLDFSTFLHVEDDRSVCLIAVIESVQYLAWTIPESWCQVPEPSNTVVSFSRGLATR